MIGFHSSFTVYFSPEKQMKKNFLFGLIPFLAIGRPDFSAVLLGFIVDAATKNEGCPRRLMPDDSQLKPTIEKKIGTPRSFEGMDSQVQEIYPGDDSSFPISYDVGRTDDVIQQPAVSIVRHPELYSEDLGPEEKNLGLNPEAAEFHPEDGTLFPSSRSGPSVPGPFENPSSRCPGPGWYIIPVVPVCAVRTWAPWGVREPWAVPGPWPVPRLGQHFEPSVLPSVLRTEPRTASYREEPDCIQDWSEPSVQSWATPGLVRHPQPSVLPSVLRTESACTQLSVQPSVLRTAQCPQPSVLPSDLPQRTIFRTKCERPESPVIRNDVHEDENNEVPELLDIELRIEVLEGDEQLIELLEGDEQLIKLETVLSSFRRRDELLLIDTTPSKVREDLRSIRREDIPELRKMLYQERTIVDYKLRKQLRILQQLCNGGTAQNEQRRSTPKLRSIAPILRSSQDIFTHLWAQNKQYGADEHAKDVPDEDLPPKYWAIGEFLRAEADQISRRLRLPLPQSDIQVCTAVRQLLILLRTRKHHVHSKLIRSRVLCLTRQNCRQTNMLRRLDKIQDDLQLFIEEFRSNLGTQ